MHNKDQLIEQIEKERAKREAERLANKGETDDERRERLLSLCRGWWQSPDGKKSIKNYKTLEGRN